MDADRWSIQVPAWLRHFGPVAIGLLFLLITLSDYSVFVGFGEREAGTRLGILLFAYVYVLCLVAARDPAIDAPTRSAAGILAVISGAAVVDETWGLHEEVGYWVQEHVRFLPFKLKLYTDDAIILGGALVGGLLLLRIIRKSGRLRELIPYVASIVVLAVMHGLLDFVSHGIAVINYLFPGNPEYASRAIEDQLSTAEECCKIWSAWFVVLFLQRFFHRERVPLVWSWAVCATTPLAALSLWQLGDPIAGVPYLKIGGSLQFIRNFNGLVELGLVWTALAGASWWALRDREEDRIWVAALFPVSTVALAGGWADPAQLGALIGRAASFLPNAYWDAGFWAYGFVALLVLGPAVLGGFLMAGAVRYGWPGVLAYAGGCAILALLAGRSAVFVAVGLAAGVLVLGLLVRGDFGARVKARPAILSAVLLGCAILVVANLGDLIPNRKFKDDEFVFFEVRYQDSVSGRRP